MTRRHPSRHCEERSDEAIQERATDADRTSLDCFALLAMTMEWPDRQFSGSSLTMEAPWLLPTQKLTGVVVLSTKTRRMLVSLGRKYSTVWLVLGSSRTTRSVVMPPVQISPFLSTTG